MKEVIAKRAALVAAMRNMLATAEAAKRALNTEEQSSYAKMETEVTDLGATIQSHNTLATVEANLALARDGAAVVPGVTADIVNKRNRAVDSANYRNALFGGYARFGNNVTPEFRNALQVGTSSEGGYIVPTEFDINIVKQLATQDPIRALATSFTTASERKIPVETDKGTFAYVDEEAAIPVNSDPAFGQVSLSAFKSGGIIKVSDELLQDSFFNLEAYLSELAAERFGTLEETSFASGDGTGKPKGLFATTSVAGVTVPLTTGAVAATATLTFDNMIDVFHNLGRRYRQNASWVFGDDAAKILRRIRDNDGQYIWQASVVMGQPDMLLGRPVVIDNGTPAVAVNAYTVALVDLKRYYIGDRLGTSMKVLNELFAGTGQIGFRFTRRNDGRLVDAKAMSLFRQGPAA